MSVPKPRGVTLSLDEKSFIVSYGVNTSMVLIDTKSLEASTDSILQPTYISGSHIYNWSKTLTEIMPTNIYTKKINTLYHRGTESSERWYC